jgi:hypothetical protein
MDDPHARLEHLLEEPYQNVLVFLLLRDGAYRHPEDEREDHQLQHVSVQRADGGLNGVARNELDQRIRD